MLEPTTTPPERLPAIDWIKFLAILAVVLTHSGTAPFPGMPGYSFWDVVFRHLLPAFHVPCLLMASGFLYHRSHAIPLRDLTPRLKRILAPYLVASFAVFALLPSAQPSMQDRIRALLLGDALGIYYYVFLLIACLILLPFLSRLSMTGLKIAGTTLLAALAAACVFPALRPSVDFIWTMRNPLESFAWGYFVLGWTMAANGVARSTSFLSRNRRLIALSALLWPACVFAGSPYPTIIVAKIPYAVLIWSTAWRHLNETPAPSFVRNVSDATYGIFLYHFLAMYPLQPYAAEWPVPIRISVLTATGVLAGLSLGFVLRRTFGRPIARTLFGY